MRVIEVIVGGQYGSEGKGALAAHLAGAGELLAVRVAGPNAGHTVIDRQGVRWPLRQVPVAAVVNPDAGLHVAPGSEVDPEVLLDEVSRLEEAGPYPVRHRLTISPEATLITPEHREYETGLVSRIGSTGKGIGAARADRLMRTATRVGDYAGWPGWLRVEPARYDDWFRVQVEGTQGYGLGLHAGHYPHATSSDCRAIDFLAMAGISPWQWGAHLEVWLTVRAYPIRVAGPSGPMYRETTWGDLGLPPEQTTVTRKTRRVGDWDQDLVEAAARANGASRQRPIHGALMMSDHRWPELAGLAGKINRTELPIGLARLSHRLLEAGVRLDLLGTGPATMLQVIA